MSNRHRPRRRRSAGRWLCLALLVGWVCAVAAAQAAPPRSGGPAPAFAFRGIKGLWWQGAAKYRAALPWLARHNMNFLMLCYSSFPASGQDWRSDYTLDEFREFRELSARADKLGVTLCLSFNPGLWSRPPLVYSSDRDFDLALRKVRLVHDCGIRWFALCLDDIGRELQPADKDRFKTLQASQAYFVNRLWRAMREIDPRMRLIFCPSAYTTEDARAHLDYIRAIGEGVDPEVMMFWTGPQCCSARITAADAREFGAWIRRKPFVWDNYPVNDMYSWRPLVAPVKGRSGDLGDAVAGYMANPMRQWVASKIPVSTLASYLSDPQGYNPAAAMEQTIAAYPARQREAIRQLVSVYGTTFWGDRNFPPQPRPRSQAEAEKLLPRYRALKAALSTTPGLRRLWGDVQPTVDQDVAVLERRASDRLAQFPLSALGDEFDGGAGDVFGYQFYGRAVNYVYSQATGRSEMRVQFRLQPVPAEGATLRLVARSDDGATQTHIRLSVNGHVAWEGVSPYSAQEFDQRKYPLPAAWLNAGTNVLTVQNLEPQGTLGMPPWFMVAEAELVVAK